MMKNKIYIKALYIIGFIIVLFISFLFIQKDDFCKFYALNSYGYGMAISLKEKNQAMIEMTRSCKEDYWEKRLKYFLDK